MSDVVVNITEIPQIVVVNVTEQSSVINIIEEVSTEVINVTPEIVEINVIETLQQVTVQVRLVTLEDLNSAGIKDLWTGTQTEYDALSPNPDVLYFIHG